MHYNVNKIMEYFTPFYDEADGEHGLKHITAVYDLALKMDKHLKVTYPKMYKGEDKVDITAAVYAHDMYSFTHRDTHAEKARDHILSMTNPIVYGFDRYRVALAVSEHRASYSGSFSNSLSALLSSADRGEPNLLKILKRVYNCATDTSLVFQADKPERLSKILEMKLPDGSILKNRVEELISIDSDPAVKKTYIHLMEKYSRVGYARYPNIYLFYFYDELEEFYQEIDSLIDVNKFLSFLKTHSIR